MRCARAWLSISHEVPVPAGIGVHLGAAVLCEYVRRPEHGRE
ncbi:hypothetical protein [Thiohalocapsa halophila]|nr:hypothetical protein [Thiohalocapsa halophila]